MAGADDLLTPAEIEALMAAARGNAGIPAPKPPAPAASSRSAPRAPASSADRLLHQAEQHLADALATSTPTSSSRMPDVSGVSAFEFQDFGKPSEVRQAPEFPIAALQDVELDLRIELGRTELLIEEVLQLREGSVVPLDKLAGDPVDILVNGRLIGRGEVLVLNDNFCVRVAEILTPQD